MRPIPVNWEAIRIEFSHGVTLRELSEKYGVQELTLRKRSSREKWCDMRPEKHVTNMSHTITEAAKSVGASWAEKGESYRSMVFDKVSQSVKAASLPPPKNYRDLEAADKIVRRAAGLDNMETQVNTIIGIGGMDSGPALASEVVVDVSCEEVPT